MGNASSVQPLLPEEYLARAIGDRHLLHSSWDVLLHSVAYLSDQADVSRCMRVCHQFYTSGHRILLSHPITLTDRNMSSFCSYMRRDISRARLLRDISVNFTSIENWETQVLIQMMRQASGLKKLSVTASTFLVDYRVGIALGELTSVEEIEAIGFNQHMHEFLFNLHCPIRKAGISFEDYESKRSSLHQKPRADLLYSLSRFHDTLEELTANFVTWQETVKRPIRQFSKLWMLHLLDHSIRDISVLENALPNLRVLKDTNLLKTRPKCFPAASTTERREPWPALDLVHTRLGNALAPCISSAVDTLRVDVTEKEYETDEPYAVILGGLKPKQLIVGFEDADVSSGFVEHVLARTPTNIRTLAVMTSTTLKGDHQENWIFQLKAIRNGLNNITYINNLTRLVLKTSVCASPEEPEVTPGPDHEVDAMPVCHTAELPELPEHYTPTAEERRELKALAASKLLRLELITVIVQVGGRYVQVSFRVHRERREVYLVEDEDENQDDDELLGLW